MLLIPDLTHPKHTPNFEVLQGVAVVQRAMRGAAPMEVMADLGFGEVHLVDSFAVNMSGALSWTYKIDVHCH